MSYLSNALAAPLSLSPYNLEVQQSLLPNTTDFASTSAHVSAKASSCWDLREEVDGLLGWLNPEVRTGVQLKNEVKVVKPAEASEMRAPKQDVPKQIISQQDVPKPAVLKQSAPKPSTPECGEKKRSLPQEDRSSKRARKAIEPEVDHKHQECIRLADRALEMARKVQKAADLAASTEGFQTPRSNLGLTKQMKRVIKKVPKPHDTTHRNRVGSEGRAVVLVPIVEVSMVCCQIDFSRNPVEFRAHYKRAHPEEKPYKCPHLGCDFKTKHRNVVNSHFQVKHDGRLNYICGHCGEARPSAKQAQRHLGTHTMASVKVERFPDNDICYFEGKFYFTLKAAPNRKRSGN